MITIQGNVRVEPHAVTTLLVAAMGFCAFWWWELGK